MACKDCKYLFAKPNFPTAPLLTRGKTTRCLYEPDAPKLPHAITKSVFFRWPPSSQYIGADDGEGCPTFEGFK